MEYIVLIIAIIVTPYLLYAWLYGATLLKKLFEDNWQEKKGLAKTVSTWQHQMTSDERMEATQKQELEQEKPANWVGSPTADKEIKDMNNKAFEEGLLHKLPQTQIEVADPE